MKLTCQKHPFESNMLNLGEDMQIYCKDRDMYGGGVAIVINKKLHPQEICIETICELVSVRICAQKTLYSYVYINPPQHLCVHLQKKSMRSLNI